MLTFTAAGAYVVTVYPPTSPLTDPSLRQLVDLYRSDPPDGQHRREDVAAAIHGRSEQLLGWLRDELTYTRLVAGPSHCLTDAHRAWLFHARSEIEAILATTDPN
jgi:hypothetical protein